MSDAAETASETVHATTIALAGAGGTADGWRAVMLCGRSGSGKSDLALRLLDRGARLVADDYTVLRGDGGMLWASPPERIAGRIEVRGIGIVARPWLAEARVALIVQLDAPPIRMPERPLPVRHIAGIAVPVLALAPFEASAPIKLELAMADLLPSAEAAR